MESLPSDLEIVDMQQQLAAAYGAPTGSKTIIKTNAGFFQLGDVFEAETVKGGKNYVIFMFEKDGWTYYCHGDKAKKVRTDHFKKCIDYGDLYPVPQDKIEPERKSLAVIGMLAMANGLSFNDYMKVYYGHGTGSEVGEFNTQPK